MRVFIALDIPGEIRMRIKEFMDRAAGYAGEARWVRPEALHVTLKFVGEVSDAQVQEIKNVLRALKAVPWDVEFAGTGFFPTAKSPRVFWVGVRGGDSLSALAAAVDHATHTIGFAREGKAYNPHLTLARSESSHLLRPLQRLVEAEPNLAFGTMTAHEFFLYRSELQHGGARYTKLERFGLR